MRDKGIFLDLTPTFYGGFLRKVTEPSIVDISRHARCGCQFRGTGETTIRSVRPTGVEIGREVCRGIGYVLVLSGKDARGSEHRDLC